MATIGWIKIGLTADTAPLAQGLGKASSMLDIFKASALGAGVAMAGAFIAGHAISGIKSMIMSASDLSENMNKVQAVFGKGSATIVNASNEMARAFGTSKNEFLDASAKLGGLFKGAGFGKEAAAGLSVEFVKLAHDAASFHNLDFTEAFRKIRAGLSGESEPLKDLGILMTEDAVKAQAMAMGLARAGQELSAQAKVQARAALITRGLADAQGDLARTAGGFANLTRNAWGQLENLGATLGAAFLPAARKAIGAAASFIGSLADWAEKSGVISTIGSLIDSVIVTPIEFLFGLVKGANDLLMTFGVDLVAVFTNALQVIGEIAKQIASVIQFFTYGKTAASEATSAAASIKPGPKPASAGGGLPGMNPRKADELHFAGAMQMGSKEAFSAVLKSKSALTQSDGQRQLQQHAQATADNTGKQVEILKAIREALMRQGGSNLPTNLVTV